MRQTIGDTTGVGGVFRASRAFPAPTTLTADMREVCPDAWLLNCTNPMAMSVWWASVVAPGIKTVGLCHSVYWTAHDLAELVGVPLEETRYRAAGVNHQAWLVEWTHQGRDLCPVLRERIAAELERRVRVEIFRRIGYYPTETSEHSSEHLSWFLRSDEQIARFRIEPLQYVGISQENVAQFETAKVLLDRGRPSWRPTPRAPSRPHGPQRLLHAATGTDLGHVQRPRHRTRRPATGPTSCRRCSCSGSAWVRRSCRR